jgi:hypothetical protein
MTSETKKGITPRSNQNQAKYVPAGIGPLQWGPGNRLTIRVRHTQPSEDYLLQGTLTVQADEQTFQATPQDFKNGEEDTVHLFRTKWGMHQEVLA